ncbi:Brain-specific angiogenesis inhibitor 1-associated protein 2 [Galemys pyrenaicus]|uniref:BAR/IMD domain-containing adapter protein 2 n=1 Tax=Galemys pyrenaicus TaxID=202257 RepID=A0A8J5ZUK1_GALPY|nr:Brain-specific angiogenesis inhibitor 1-associated protein 2 [Galemys pyrenaicus]
MLRPEAKLGPAGVTRGVAGAGVARVAGCCLQSPVHGWPEPRGACLGAGGSLCPPPSARRMHADAPCTCTLHTEVRMRTPHARNAPRTLTYTHAPHARNAHARAPRTHAFPGAPDGRLLTRPSLPPALLLSARRRAWGRRGGTGLVSEHPAPASRSAQPPPLPAAPLRLPPRPGRARPAQAQGQLGAVGPVGRGPVPAAVHGGVRGAQRPRRLWFLAPLGARWPLGWADRGPDGVTWSGPASATGARGFPGQAPLARAAGGAQTGLPGKPVQPPRGPGPLVQTWLCPCASVLALQDPNTCLASTRESHLCLRAAESGAQAPVHRARIGRRLLTAGARQSQAVRPCAGAACSTSLRARHSVLPSPAPREGGVCRAVMEQFNPSLRNFIAMGKNYEKALAGVTYAAKGYFDALVKMGELASESQGSKELGDVLFQMAEVHRQIQNQLEEMLKSFHNELLMQLEQKVELDSRYLSAALKKYQTEQRSKGDALDKCQAELKKLRKKSQGSKNPQKYSDKELQVGGAWAQRAERPFRQQLGAPRPAPHAWCWRFIDAISSKQGELESYVSDGYKTALTEERRRFCFLVEKQCAVAKNAAAYHCKGKELLAQKLPLWQQACADPNKIPERAVQLMQQGAVGNGAALPSALSASKSDLLISDPIPGAKPLPVPPELAPFVGRLSAQDNVPVLNGIAGPDGEDYSPWADRKAQAKSSSPPQSQGKMSDSYSNTLPVRKSVTPKNSYATTENKTLPRSSSMAAGLERNGRTRVKAIFSHAAGDNSTLLSFKEGDLITLLVPEARDGWHYGESEKTKMRGWFPFSYTRVLDSDGSDRLHMSLQQGKSSSTGNLLDKDDLALPPPDYGTASRAFPTQTAGAFKQRPYSVAVPAFSQVRARAAWEGAPSFPPASQPQRGCSQRVVGHPGGQPEAAAQPSPMPGLSPAGWGPM